MKSERKRVRRGWLNTHHYGVQGNPPRQGCRWSDVEDFDLIEAWTRGVSGAQLARTHQRSEGSIDMRLPDTFRGDPGRSWPGACRFMQALERMVSDREMCSTCKHCKEGRSPKMWLCAKNWPGLGQDARVYYCEHWEDSGF